MENNLKIRNEMVKARVSEEEKNIIKGKAKFYGYRNISDYIRDSAIHEKVTYVDLKNRKLIYDAYSENTKEIKEIIKHIRHMCKFLTQIKDDDIRVLQGKLFRIIRLQQEMLKLIGKKLDLDVWQKINRNKNCDFGTYNGEK